MPWPGGTDRLIGRCGLGIRDSEIGEAVLWYTLHPTYWGRGYTTEAALAIVDFGFRELRLHRIWADCDPANIASCRVIEKIGMRREAHLRENAKIKGKWVDSLIYAILAREWRSLRRALRGAAAPQRSENTRPQRAMSLKEPCGTARLAHRRPITRCSMMIGIHQLPGSR
jgi:hypothetical protein